MTEMSLNEVIEQLTAILDEAFEHPPKPWSHFTDPSPDSGYFGTLAKLSFVEAGQAVAGTSVAAQVNHVTFAMAASAAYIQGDPGSPDLEQWQASWQTPDLDEATWNDCRKISGMPTVVFAARSKLTLSHKLNRLVAQSGRSPMSRITLGPSNRRSPSLTGAA